MGTKQQPDLMNLAGKQAKNRSTPSTPSTLGKHLVKTKLCVFFQSGTCKAGANCGFAHGPSELEGSPDLWKTRMCSNFQLGKCNDPTCKYAHGHEELRSTEFYYKKTMCLWYPIGKCRNGNMCRFAHGPVELRAPEAAVAQQAQMAQMAALQEPGRRNVAEGGSKGCGKGYGNAVVVPALAQAQAAPQNKERVEHHRKKDKNGRLKQSARRTQQEHAPQIPEGGQSQQEPMFVQQEPMFVRPIANAGFVADHQQGYAIKSPHVHDLKMAGMTIARTPLGLNDIVFQEARSISASRGATFDGVAGDFVDNFQGSMSAGTSEDIASLSQNVKLLSHQLKLLQQCIVPTIHSASQSTTCHSHTDSSVGSFRNSPPSTPPPIQDNVPIQDSVPYQSAYAEVAWLRQEFERVSNAQGLLVSRLRVGETM